MPRAARLGWAMWWALGLLAALEYVHRWLAPAWPAGDAAGQVGAWLRFAEVVVGLALLGLAFVVAAPALKALAATNRPAAPADQAHAGLAFPHPVTLVVGAVVLAIAVGSAWGLLLALRADLTDTTTAALVCMLSAGVGSSVATLMGFLQHASEEKNFDPAYSAWYVGRPVMGALLGLIFYFMLRGGLVALAVSGTDELDPFVLAGVGGLVGLFSKNALEKLREVFNVAFKVERPPDGKGKKRPGET